MITRLFLVSRASTFPDSELTEMSSIKEASPGIWKSFSFLPRKKAVTVPPSRVRKTFSLIAIWLFSVVVMDSLSHVVLSPNPPSARGKR